MKITKIKLNNYKRFDDLTIDLTEHKDKKIIALVGSNGCGKSSIFDAFLYFAKTKYIKRYDNSVEDIKYHRKNLWISEKDNENLKKLDSTLNNFDLSYGVKIENNQNNKWNKKSFYIRSAYRMNQNMNVEEIRSKPLILADTSSPSSMIGIDNRIQESYINIFATVLEHSRQKQKNPETVWTKIIDPINNILKKVLNIQISGIGNVLRKEGQLYFDKGKSKEFPFQNLSSGEKEVLDLIIDLFIKREEFNNTIFCIDEPELHINSSIQKKLLIEIEKLIPDNCQLWIATHSVGFVQALISQSKNKSEIINFSERENNFDEKVILKPIEKNSKNFIKIFDVALDDLSSLLFLFEIVVFCEGKVLPNEKTNLEEGLDAQVYNEIFKEKKVWFVSAGGRDVRINSIFPTLIISKKFPKVEFLCLKDKDYKTDEDRNKFLNKSKTNRMLKRRAIENYLFDIEILKKYNKEIDETKYKDIVKDIEKDEMKKKSQKIRQICKSKEDPQSFKLKLAELITPETKVYQELERIIFKNEK